LRFYGEHNQEAKTLSGTRMNPAKVIAGNRPVVLRTGRLLLRPLRPDDIPALLPRIGAREVASTTLRVPHPYTQEDAEVPEI
jgi:hypothetical protein